MSDIRWKLRRLQAMPAGEVVHRVGIAVRDRLAPPQHGLWTSVEAFERLYEGTAAEVLASSRLPSLVHLPPRAEGLDDAVAAARDLLDGRWPLFGRQVRLDDPPRWNRNYRDGREWPDVSSSKIDYHDPAAAGGAKWTWELGRLTVLPTLALGWRLTGDERLAERCVRWLDDWNEQNPLGHGIHYTSGIESAVRVLTVGWTLALLADRARGANLEATLGLLAQQVLHMRDHLSLGSSANNHLIGEYAAITVLSGMFPALRDAGRLLEAGVSGLEQEVLLQFHSDGVPAEQALGYLPFIWELLLCAFVTAAAAGRPTSPQVHERLRASLEFARAARLADGRLPPFGDEDDARVLLAETGAPRLDRVGNALAAWLGAPALSGDDALARLLVGRVAGPGAAPVGARTFAEGGYTVWREGDLFAMLDHGPLGYLSLAAHGHADALSLVVSRGADPIITDPGTFAYHADQVLRDRCRSTPAHATVNFAGRNQSEMLGAFMWGRRAAVSERDGGHEVRWASGERHWRRVEVQGTRVTVDDRVAGADPRLVYPLAPGARVETSGRTARVTSGASTATFEVDGAPEWTVTDGELAPRFGELVSAPRLEASLGGPSARTAITLE